MPTASPTLLRFFSSPHGIGVAIFVVAYLIVASALHRYAIRDPSSAFFNPDIGFERAYSLIREEQAKVYIDQSAGSPPYSATASGQTLCVGIPTVKRENARYFKTAFGSVLEGLTPEERSDIVLLPFIAQTDPTQHIAFNESWSHDLPDRLLTYDLPEDVAAHVKYLEVADIEHQEKSRFDYIYSLKACYNASTPYILMLEDDVLAVKGWYPRLKTALNRLEALNRVHETLYVRLFYTEIFLGWNSEEWARYLSYCVAFELVLAGALMTLRRRHGAAARFLTRPALFAILLVASPAVIGLYFAVGRMTVQPLASGISEMNKYGCCSQALLFPRERVPALTAYVDGVGSGPVDSVIEDYANAHAWTRWAVSPALYQHIGGHSSKAPVGEADGFWGMTKAAVLWNFRYEEYSFAE